VARHASTTMQNKMITYTGDTCVAPIEIHVTAVLKQSTLVIETEGCK